MGARGRRGEWGKEKISPRTPRSLPLCAHQIVEKKKKTKAVCEQLRGGSLTTGDRSPDGLLLTRVIFDVFDWRCIWRGIDEGRIFYVFDSFPGFALFAADTSTTKTSSGTLSSHVIFARLRSKRRIAGSLQILLRIHAVIMRWTDL